MIYNIKCIFYSRKIMIDIKEITSYEKILIELKTLWKFRMLTILKSNKKRINVKTNKFNIKK